MADEDDDKGKGLLALMVGSPKPSADKEDDDAPASDKSDAVKEFFAAGKAGEWDEAALIFERLYEMCSHAYDEEDEDEEE
jgi:hypothetical protein